MNLAMASEFERFMPADTIVERKPRTFFTQALCPRP